MAQRFVIDINLNGAQGQPSNEGFVGGALAGSAMRSTTKSQQLIADRMTAFNERFAKKEKLTGATFSADPLSIQRQRQGLLTATWTGQGTMTMPGIPGKIPEQLMDRTFYGSKTQEFLVNNRKTIQTLGIAAAWKVANSTVDYKNYTSGDSYENERRSNNMRLATYGATLIATGFNPAVIVGIVGNEIINGISESRKYDYDRKLGRGQITNIKQIAGNVSYGRGNRGDR